MKLKAIRDACLASAEAFLAAAERELGKGADHISFHLALLAFEEIGKSILATIEHITTVGEREREDNLSAALEDHPKKIFWALWGGGLMRNNTLSAKDIQENQRLANTLHDRRLETLYTDTKNPLPVPERIPEAEARAFTEFARLRLEIEKANELVEYEDGDVETIKWFFAITDDPEKRKEVFNAVTLAKLRELKNGRDWITWLREEHRNNETAMRKYAEKELRRAKPEGEDQYTPKYKMRIRIQTTSHSVRGGAFTKWNAGVHNVKIYKSDRKDAKALAKGELLLDFIFPKGLHASYLWEHGLFMSKTVVIALNVGTLGVFWWNVQKDVARFYEEIQDLEADPNGNIALAVEPHRRLHVDFGPARLVLNEQAMENVYLTMAFLMRKAQKLEAFLKGYAFGMALFSKTDIHLPMEVNAFEEFYKALKAGMLALGDWDEQDDFLEAVKRQFSNIGDMKGLDETLALGTALEVDTGRQKVHPITLTNVVAMKVYCDYYILHKSREEFEAHHKTTDGAPSTEKPSDSSSGT